MISCPTALPLTGHGDPLDNYVSTQGASLLTGNKKHLEAGSIADCVAKCEEETDFVCRYFYCHCPHAGVSLFEALLFCYQEMCSGTWQRQDWRGKRDFLGSEFRIWIHANSSLFNLLVSSLEKCPQRNLLASIILSSRFWCHLTSLNVYWGSHVWKCSRPQGAKEHRPSDPVCMIHNTAQGRWLHRYKIQTLPFVGNAAVQLQKWDKV